ncbi:olfactory receptor 52D1-like [Pelodytes ibericus]
MPNSTFSQLHILTLNFGELTSIRYLYCVIVLLGYVLIIISNGVVISVVIRNDCLQEPMYLLLSALCLNGMYGSTAFYPSLFINLMYNDKTISHIGCLTQIFCIHTYVDCEMTILTVMAFDRYLCICNPLRYNIIMSLSTIYKLVCGAWIFCVTLVGIAIILTARLPLCSFSIIKFYCDNWSLVRLSCVDTSVNNVYGLFISILFLVVMPILIMSSYAMILRVCVKLPKGSRSKALQTCTPQLVTVTNFVVDMLFELFLYRSAPASMPYELRVVMSVQPAIVPPLLNALVYGLKVKEIREHIVQLFHF